MTPVTVVEAGGEKFQFVAATLGARVIMLAPVPPVRVRVPDTVLVPVVENEILEA